MNRIAKLLFVLLAVSLTVPTVLLAQEAPAPAAPQPPQTMDHGAMPGVNMHGMMNMMVQMNKMMENCNQMMQSMNEHTNQNRGKTRSK